MQTCHCAHYIGFNTNLTQSFTLFSVKTQTLIKSGKSILQVSEDSFNGKFQASTRCKDSREGWWIPFGFPRKKWIPFINTYNCLPAY